MAIADPSLYQAIYDMVSLIPTGKVATYGQIARLLNRPRHARQIGYALFRVAPESPVPWHRVVNARGQISKAPSRLGSDELQRLLLEAEDVQFGPDDRIDLQRFQWDESTLPDAQPGHPID